jgi:hypothetical protein
MTNEHKEPWTPGPWELWKDHDEVFAKVRNGRNTSHSISGVRIAECDPEDLYDGLNSEHQCRAEAQANARLIAEAPAMAELLKRLIDLWTDIGYDHSANRLFHEADALLRRARGEGRT